MGIYRGQILFETADAGWSETYFFNVADLSTAFGNLNNVAIARAPLSPAAVKLPAIRVSDVTQPRLAELGNPTPSQGGYTTVTTVVDPAISMMAREISTDFLTRSRHYLRGLPTDQLFGGASDPILWAPTGPWTTAFNTWASVVGSSSVLGVRNPVTKTYTTKPMNDPTQTLLAVIRRAGRPFGLRRGRRLVV